MTRTRRRGLSLAILLLVMLALTVILGAFLGRVGSARQAARRQETRAQASYDASSAMNLVLARVRAGQDPQAAARVVAATTGIEVLVAGDRVLVTSGGTSLQARLQPRAWKHVLFANTLNLNGLRGSFRADDPHLPAQGAPPNPTSTFAETMRARARFSGIHLTADVATSQFRPGGGTWQEMTVEGRPSFVYMGGGAGDSLGWVPGVFRWRQESDRWISTAGDEVILLNGTWILRPPLGRTATLAGTIFVEDASLQLRGNVTLQGQVVVWGGSLQSYYGTLRVSSWPDTLALAALTGSRTPSGLSWTQDSTPRPGDVIFPSGWSRLVVGDVRRPEETGAFVLAQGRLVKRGARLMIAGVVAAGRADIDGVPAGDLVWSSRVGRQAPTGFTSTDIGATMPNKLDIR